MSWYDDFYHYERTTRRKVTGGIKAQSRRGAFGRTWWGKRWVEVLEGFRIGAQLGRGKSYARSGQVLSIDIAKGRVDAEVQGSRVTPYAAVIQLKTYPSSAWKRVTERLREQPFFAAKLMAGTMPSGLAQVCADAGLALFPEREADLETHCSCPDWSNPCKHLAAIYYLLAEEFDRDPFLLFRLRGITREELLSTMFEAVPHVSGGAAPRNDDVFTAEPLVAHNSFWQGSDLPDDFFGSMRVPSKTAALPQRLGPFPFWRGQRLFVEALTPHYKYGA